MENENLFNIDALARETLNNVKLQYEAMRKITTDVVRNANTCMCEYLSDLTDDQGTNAFIPFDLSDIMLDDNNKKYADYTFKIDVDYEDECVNDRVIGIEIVRHGEGNNEFYVCFENIEQIEFTYMGIYDLNKILRTAMYVVTQCEDKLSRLINLTPVVFYRETEGKVIAIFPQKETKRGCFISFIIGEGFESCDINHYHDLANKEEYKATYSELLRQGYMLKVLN